MMHWNGSHLRQHRHHASCSADEELHASELPSFQQQQHSFKKGDKLKNANGEPDTAEGCVRGMGSRCPALDAPCCVGGGRVRVLFFLQASYIISLGYVSSREGLGAAISASARVNPHQPRRSCDCPRQISNFLI